MTPRLPARRLIKSAAGSFLVLSLCALPASAQIPGVMDSTARDSAKAIRLKEITVTVTRVPQALMRTAAAVGVLDSTELRRGQATVGLDEALNNLPGVYVANRYNFSLDQRLSIRGFGSRSNFGLRGVKVLLDGVPQTLPDGQSQLTNVDLANVNRVEVLRGSSSSLYGNASGGVIALSSRPAAAEPFAGSVRAEGGANRFFKIQSFFSGRSGPVSGTLGLSHSNVDGFRQQSASHWTQVNLGLDYAAGSASSAALRFAYAGQPEAQNPGALTLAEYLANPDSAAPRNILRRADKDVNQEQLALTLRHLGAAGRSEYSATVFGFLRGLKNPLANDPPQGTGPDIGTYVDIDRVVGGVRLGAKHWLGSSANAPQLNTGIDLQRMRDHRKNFRSIGGIPDTAVQDQIERVTELGPFAQLLWQPGGAWLLSTGVRYDFVRFEVDDRHLSDGVDNTGDRNLASFSGNVGASYYVRPEFTPYVEISTSFETPTTTELANQPNTTGGFNDQLNPQRAVNYEVGARGVIGSDLSYSAAFFLGRIHNPIVQYREVGGRAYFQNAGRLHNDGFEVGLSYAPTRRFKVFGNYTYADYRFAEYRIVNGTTVDTLDGKRLAGVPRAFVRLGLRTEPLRGLTLDVDHTMSSSLFADDDNTLVVYGWGRKGPNDVSGFGLGVTNLRVNWQRRYRASVMSPFFGINNLWDRHYVGSVTVNGVGGRVFEPAPGRNVYLGIEINWTALQ